MIKPDCQRVEPTDAVPSLGGGQASATRELLARLLAGPSGLGTPYLAARLDDNFYTSMRLIDVVGGYELPANLFYDRPFHQALTQAGMASVIVNDLHSAAREAEGDQPDFNLILLLAAEEDCSLPDAIERAVGLHNDLVRAFEEVQQRLAAVPSMELQRFLRGAQAWMAGCLEWHATSSRYNL